MRNPPSSNHAGQRSGKVEDLDFELLYLIEKEPDLTQRQLAQRLGISVGKVNYCLKALMEKGGIKLANFRSSDKKMSYAYRLTPKGVRHRMQLTQSFLDRKIAEFDRLKGQIEALQNDLSEGGPK